MGGGGCYDGMWLGRWLGRWLATVVVVVVARWMLCGMTLWLLYCARFGWHVSLFVVSGVDLDARVSWMDCFGLLWFGFVSLQTLNERKKGRKRGRKEGLMKSLFLLPSQREKRPPLLQLSFSLGDCQTVTTTTTTRRRGMTD